MPRVLKLVVGAMGERGREMPDNQTSALCSTCFSARANFPRTNFPNGVSNLSKLTAAEVVGCSFPLLLFMLTAQGYEELMFDRYTKYLKKQREDNRTGSVDDNTGTFMATIRERRGKPTRCTKSACSFCNA